jgi:hypothetical protein
LTAMPPPLVVGQYLNGHRLILSDGVHPDLSETKPCCLLDLLQALQVMKAPRTDAVCHGYECACLEDGRTCHGQIVITAFQNCEVCLAPSS